MTRTPDVPPPRTPALPSGMSDPHPPTWRLFWAKSDYDRSLGRGPEWTHPLWAHLLDVAHTALLLWERDVPDALRRAAADALALPEREAGHLLSLHIGLHDWGKATPSFSDRHPSSWAALTARGLDHGAADAQRHELSTIALVHRQRQGEGAGRGDFWTHLGAFVGFHHGWLYAERGWRKASREAGSLGASAAWAGPQADLHREVAAAWRRRYPWADPPRVPAESPPDWLLGLAGWATFADWLGSIAECFPADVDRADDLDAYLDRSRAGAERALARVGRTAPRRGLVAKSFDDLFQDDDGRPFDAPRPLQALVLAADFPAVSADGPTLTLIEAPTGEGKTEAALALAARQQDGRRGGLYLGLPTKATANGLVERALRFLENAHAGGPADFRLAHGDAPLLDAQQRLIEDAPDLAPTDLAEIDGGGDARVRTLRWFVSSKRALLAPYGLGTIDQAMLGAVRGRHFFLRLYGLAGKTVVLDEVHAYDVYMQAIIGRLVGWLRALGASVVLLSATLPARLRQSLVRAWDPDATGGPTADPADVSYPAVWTVADGRVRLHDTHDGQRLTADRTQRATLRRHDPEPEAVAETVARAVAEGAVVGVIVNTVARAQAVFQAVEAAVGGRLADDSLVLFHARFLHRDRAETERAVVGHRDDDGAWVPGRFGKGRAAGPAVLVATQVAEQSLDLDLDLLLTDLAPIDLVLQRAGRLHRHDRADRPPAHAEPRVVWLCPDAPADGLPQVQSADVPFGFVYDPVVLWRTWRRLVSREDAEGVGRWSLPADYRPLIEAVYPADEAGTAVPAPPDDLSEPAAERWRAEVDGARKEWIKSVRAAEAQTIPAPCALAELLEDDDRTLHDEDDDRVHRTMRAATREGDSQTVVVLFGDGDALFLDSARTVPVSLDGYAPERSLPAHVVRQWLGASLSLSHAGVVAALRADESEDARQWEAAVRRTPALRNARLLVLKKDGSLVGGRRVSYDTRLGLVLATQSA